ncbi:signal peptidase II [Sandarakinorhabdus sp.]|uniref:signal peptidase II n=1 Tax=Sandarakinorhabdus sp. TaxID=1916663 RepID=UPI00286E3DA9|nr:signal peptidase II [Sandarakinorhabdus sp.]
MAEMAPTLSNPLARLGFAVAALVLVIDQVSKYWVLEVIHLPLRGFIDVAPFFRLTFVGNVGVSMGLFAGGSEVSRWVLTIVTAGIAVAVALWLARERQQAESLALALVLGGALGNIVDRLRFGYVVDFLHFFWGAHSFWVFNVADAGISLGVVILLGRALMAPKDKSDA